MKIKIILILAGVFFVGGLVINQVFINQKDETSQYSKAERDRFNTWVKPISGNGKEY